MTMTDPFASAPTEPEEAQQQEVAVEAPEPVRAPAFQPKPVVVTNLAPTSDGKWVATFKGGSAYDAPWLVGHLSSLQEVNDYLTGDNAVLLADTFDKLQRAAGKFVSLAPTKAPVAAGGGSAPAAANPSAPPRGAVSAPGGESRQCKHGEMTFKTGFSAKTNKTWSAFMCPSPKGTPDQCDAEWLR